MELLPIVGIALLFWFMIIRPQSRQRKAVLAMQASGRAGTAVWTNPNVGGLTMAALGLLVVMVVRRR